MLLTGRKAETFYSGSVMPRENPSIHPGEKLFLMTTYTLLTVLSFSVAFLVDILG